MASNKASIAQDYYVYELAYPDGTVFYVGKGKGDRIDQHEREARKGVQSYKCNVIRQIERDGGKVLKYKIQDHMTEENAYRLEIDLIRMYGREHLTNLTDGGEGATSYRIETYKRTTIELPESILDFLATLKPSRTEWIIEAIREKREREEQS